eukprot:c38741_g1_i1 orf=303-1244(-)
MIPAWNEVCEMAFEQVSSRLRLDRLCRFCPLLAILFLVLVFLLHFDLLVSENADMQKRKSEIQEAGEAHSPGYSTIYKLPMHVGLSLVHYASTNVTPQQTKQEIMVTAQILEKRSPCNFLVFGLGFDSLLWATLNFGGNTVFLEEDESWITQVAKKHPDLKAYHVKYGTTLTQAKKLLATSRNEKEKCRPVQNLLNSECKLAIKGLPMEVYTTEWDVIMIDAPRGYFPAAPGRMTAIFSAGLIARGGSRVRETDILVHDIDRPVERDFSKEFLCAENRVAAVGKLWHFHITVDGLPQNQSFCTTSQSNQVKMP